MLDGGHTYPQNQSSMDCICLAYAEMIHASAGLNQPLAKKVSSSLVGANHLNSLNKKGYAIPKRKNVQFSFKQRRFVYDAFIHGEETGKKQSAEQLVIKMRSFHDTSGKKVFAPIEYLKKSPIISMFSRFSSQFRENKLQPPKEDIPQKVRKQDLDTEEADLQDDIDDEVEVCLQEVISSNQIKVGDFVYVGSGKSRKHYVAQLTDMEDKEIQLSFTIKSGKQYMWPEERDLENKWIPRSDTFKTFHALIVGDTCYLLRTLYTK